MGTPAHLDQGASMATSQNGWSAGSRSELGITTFTVPGSLVRLPLRPGPAAIVLLWVAAQFDQTVEDLDTRAGVRGYDVPDDWGFAQRTIRGDETTLSNHASGTAIDLNAVKHPLGVRGTFAPTQVAAIRRILAHLEGTVRWGGDYKSRADEMHFEINAPEAVVTRVAAKLGGTVIPGVPAPAPVPVQPDATRFLKHGSTGEAVAHRQRQLNGVALKVGRDDGIFGDRTESATRAFQLIAGLEVDGVIGPQTGSALDSAYASRARGLLAADGRLGAKTIAFLQHIVGTAVDGDFGPASRRKLQSYLGVKVDGDFGPKSTMALQRRVGARADGDWGPKTTTALQVALNTGRF